jgi:exopolysaccharide biosynthesis WecB/TagA/CpsF family protein
MTATTSLAPDLAPPLAYVDGWPIHFESGEHAVKILTEATLRGETYLFAPLNLDLLVKLRADGDKVFSNAMRRARYVISDGWPVAMLGRRQHPRIQRRTGADLIIPLCENCARNGTSIYLFGTSPEVLEKSSVELERRIPGLKIVGSESPPLGFDPASAVADASIERIRESGARMCFLALGAPKQEILAIRALDQGVDTGFICVGAGLDFIAGAQVRAPSFMRDHGMEGLWRMITSPKRLGKRYAMCAALLAQIVLIEPWLGKQKVRRG